MQKTNVKDFTPALSWPLPVVPPIVHGHPPPVPVPASHPGLAEQPLEVRPQGDQCSGRVPALQDFSLDEEITSDTQGGVLYTCQGPFHLVTDPLQVSLFLFLCYQVRLSS